MGTKSRQILPTDRLRSTFILKSSQANIQKRWKKNKSKVLKENYTGIYAALIGAGGF